MIQTILNNTATLTKSSNSVVEEAAIEFLLHSIRQEELWMVKGKPLHGLILDKSYTAELIPFGGAVGLPTDRATRAVIPLGEVFLTLPGTYAERQWAYRRRIHGIHWQQRIAEAYPCYRRAQLLLFSLWHYCPSPIIYQLPTDVLARLAGVSPKMMAQARNRYWEGDIFLYPYSPNSVTP